MLSDSYLAAILSRINNIVVGRGPKSIKNIPITMDTLYSLLSTPGVVIPDNLHEISPLSGGFESHVFSLTPQQILKLRYNIDRDDMFRYHPDPFIPPNLRLNPISEARQEIPDEYKNKKFGNYFTPDFIRAIILPRIIPLDQAGMRMNVQKLQREISKDKGYFNDVALRNLGMDPGTQEVYIIDEGVTYKPESPKLLDLNSILQIPRYPHPNHPGGFLLEDIIRARMNRE